MSGESKGSEAPLFNSQLETGLRALVLLEAIYPRPCDLIEMAWFDHLVVHTSDLDGLSDDTTPPSLHPDLPGRDGELFVRRRLVEESLHMMHRMHLVDIQYENDGIYFLASEDVPSFLDMLQAPYTVALKRRATWLAEHVRELPAAAFAAMVEEKIGRWVAEFVSEEIPGQKFL
ncbi:ABC-three component system middle component 2 [Novosphingobium aerophilum]|uniref:ABC-three component system middle component 2 n=1 Tax=Novosphingobium aerophilum TaxID=2839843 RepID=UPI003FD3A809